GAERRDIGQLLSDRAHHVAAAGKMQREHLDMEQGRLPCSSSHRVGNIVKLEIQEDPALSMHQVPHDFRAARQEELGSYLIYDGQTLKRVHQVQRLVSLGKIQGYDQFRRALNVHFGETSRV